MALIINMVVQHWSPRLLGCGRGLHFPIYRSQQRRSLVEQSRSQSLIRRRTRRRSPRLITTTTMSPPHMYCTINEISSSNADGCSSSRKYDALLLDAGGTLLQLAKPVEETYATLGRKYGMKASIGEVKQGFRRAFAAPWPEKLRYQGDGRPFWRLVVSEATGCSNNDYFEEVYEYFADGGAWHLPSGAYEAMSRMKDAGVKLAVVSNFDTRLGKLLKELNVADLFDAIIISSEVGHEKPNPEIFKAALDGVSVDASKAVHVGDDLQADKVGANAVGIDCWLWGSDVKTFAEIEDRILNS